ncbi:YheT family hydrolase [Siphonobacter sp.]|uniref:YheT family hydrolase n=1 Tax=Siphonobacter sp. TaxID=1869184 RepID=UPI003B3B81C7
MPLVTDSSYHAPFWMQNAHFSTIYPSTLRRVAGITYTRERLELADGDFLDIDWSFAHQPHSSNPPLALLTHGYLGNSTRQYMLGAVRAFNEAGFDALAWNHRGLSGEANRLEKMTTHGSTDDLAEVVHYALAKGYTSISLVGFSKGGNLALKYAGEQGSQLSNCIQSLVAVSTPTDMPGSMAACRGTFYEWYFLRKLRKFLSTRKHLIDQQLYAQFDRYRTLDDFSNEYISPFFGWKDYAEATSALPYLPNIRVRSLLLNAQNDPILSPSCSPKTLARQSDYLWLETPRLGGHCGFYEASKDGLYWVDRRIVNFVQQESKL